MIYKFEDCVENGIEMEVWMHVEAIDFVSFSIKDSGDDESYISVNIDKDDVYSLIGALHLLHKKMK